MPIMKLRLLTLLLVIPTWINAQKMVLKAAHLFDGMEMHKDFALLIEGNTIVEVGDFLSLRPKGDTILDFGNKTLISFNFPRLLVPTNILKIFFCNI